MSHMHHLTTPQPIEGVESFEGEPEAPLFSDMEEDDAMLRY